MPPAINHGQSPQSLIESASDFSGLPREDCHATTLTSTRKATVSSNAVASRKRIAGKNAD